MWVYSQIDIKTPLKWGGQDVIVKKGFNELSDEIGLAFFVYGFKLPVQIQMALKGKSEEMQQDIYDEQLMFAVKHALMRHGKTKNDIAWLKGFTCAATREECEAMVKGDISEVEEE